MNCSACGTSIGNRVRSGLCRPCYFTAYYSVPENRARRVRNGKAWAKANPARHREKSLQWQRDNPDRTKEIYRKTAQGPVNRYTREVYRAKKRGIEWSLSREELTALRSNPCHYCGADLNAFGSGLDRKDNDKGYHLDNVVPCCRECNLIKSNRLTYTEMKAAMTAVLEVRRRHG